MGAPKGIRGLFKGLTPNVVKLCIASFFTDISSEMIYPLTPIFLTTTLKASPAIVGFIEGLAEAVASIMKAVSGRLSDMAGRRKPFVFVGYFLSAAAKPLIAAASGWMLVFIGRVSDRFGKGLRSSPRDALIADSIDARRRGFAFGWHRAFDTVGAVIGPLIAILCIRFMDDLRLAFVLAFIPALIGALTILSVKEGRCLSCGGKLLFRFNLFPLSFRRYLVAWCTFSAANSSDVFLILRAREVGYSMSWTIALYAFYNFIYALASPYLGHLSDKINRRYILMGGLGVFAIVYAGFAVTPYQWQLWLLFGIYGIYMAATDGINRAFALDLVSEEVRATAVGVLGMSSGIATLIASSVAGVLWSAFGSWAAFAYGAGGALIGIVMLFGVSDSRVRD